jgi:4-carboxymuconolactone decarboxylase
MSEERTPAQRAIGDFSPKPVDLADNGLFGDIWAKRVFAEEASA